MPTDQNFEILTMITRTNLNHEKTKIYKLPAYGRISYRANQEWGARDAPQAIGEAQPNTKGYCEKSQGECRAEAANRSRVHMREG
jgi:hypothetical protein